MNRGRGTGWITNVHISYISINQGTNGPAKSFHHACLVFASRGFSQQTLPSPITEALMRSSLEGLWGAASSTLAGWPAKPRFLQTWWRWSWGKRERDNRHANKANYVGNGHGVRLRLTSDRLAVRV